MKKAIFIFFLILLGVQTVSAVGIGVNPGRIEVHFSEDKPINRELTVVNTGSTSAKYIIYIDDDYKSYLAFNQTEFTLQPSHSTRIRLTFIPIEKQRIKKPFVIYLLGRPTVPNTNVNAGVKVPVNISSSVSSVSTIASSQRSSLSAQMNQESEKKDAREGQVLVNSWEMESTNHIFGILIAFAIPLVGGLLFFIFHKPRNHKEKTFI
jgi:hypothetical protein